MDLTQGRLVIFKSEDGETNWAPVKPEDVPEWVKDRDTLGHMVAGLQAQNDGAGPWYRAQRIPEAANDAHTGDVPKKPDFLEPRGPMAAHKPLVLIPDGRR